MTGVDNNISEPLKFEIFGGVTARPPYKARAFGTCDNAPPSPLQKTYGPAFLLTSVNTLPLRI